jgi:hypothetical protein
MKAESPKKLQLFSKTASKNNALLTIRINFHQYTNFPRRPWPPEAQSAFPPGAALTAWYPVVEKGCQLWAPLEEKSEPPGPTATTHPLS